MRASRHSTAGTSGTASHSSQHDMLAIISCWYLYGPFFFVAYVMSDYLIDGLKKIFSTPEGPPWHDVRGICHICHMVNPALNTIGYSTWLVQTQSRVLKSYCRFNHALYYLPFVFSLSVQRRKCRRTEWPQDITRSIYHFVNPVGPSEWHLSHTGGPPRVQWTTVSYCSKAAKWHFYSKLEDKQQIGYVFLKCCYNIDCSLSSDKPCKGFVYAFVKLRDMHIPILEEVNPFFSKSM